MQTVDFILASVTTLMVIAWIAGHIAVETHWRNWLRDTPREPRDYRPRPAAT